MHNIKAFYYFIYDIYSGRRILWSLSKNDFRAKFASSFLGILWAFIQPLVTVFVFWFVFQVGFKNPPVEDMPFIVWFVPAYLVWAFFSEALPTSTNCLMEYNYLLKKVDFRVSMIPLVKVFSSMYVHLFFIGVIFVINACYKIPVSIYNLQVFYYFFCTIVLLVGLSWLLSSLAVFIKDTVNVVNVLIQIGFWLTPIFWDPASLSPTIQNLFKFNPMFYICRGYRDCFVNKIWFWEYGWSNLYFWIIAIGVFILGAITFKKLRPHFVDVL